MMVGNEGIARVFALADAIKPEPFGKLHRHVFHRVHGDVCLVFQERGLQFLDEQTLAANLRQRRVEQLVAATDHGHQADLQARVGTFQARLDIFGLPQGQGTLTGSNADFARHEQFRKR